MPEGITLSTTQFNAAARCLKRYEYRHVLNLIPRPRDVRPTMRRGTWIHRCLELHDLGVVDWRDELLRMRDWAINNGVDEDKARLTSDETATLVEDYISFWGQRESDDGGPFETVATEIKLEYEPVPGRKISATLDRIVKDRKGRLWVWERK